MVSNIPRHIAIIMDGNGRWAQKKKMPRIAGHQRGVESLRNVVKACIQQAVSYLTVFAFSSENWRRPPEEVAYLMQLFLSALSKEVGKLHNNGVCLKIIGDLSAFEPRLQVLIEEAQVRTAANTRLVLSIAVNYGGRWDILQAMNKLFQAHPEKIGRYTEDDLAPFLSIAYAPEPDLFIRTGGEQRISNFLVWQMAYTECYFTDTLWPEFDEASLEKAIKSYARRERRFGRTSEQLRSKQPT